MKREKGEVRWLIYKCPLSQTTAMQTVAREKALERIPLKRFGTVEEIAEAAVFLVTNQYANNCVINLDGGMSAVSSSCNRNSRSFGLAFGHPKRLKQDVV